MLKTKPDYKTYIAASILILPMLLVLSFFSGWYIDEIDNALFNSRIVAKQLKHMNYINKNRGNIANAYRAFRNNRSLSDVVLLKNSIDPGKKLVSTLKELNKTSCPLPEHINLSVSEESNSETVSADFTTSCKMHDFYNLLILINNARPVLFIDKLRIVTRDKQYNTFVEASFTVSAYVIH